ncbi:MULTISPECIES: hypothetical protein [unclassified Streptomyces]|uniref:hypothetical protein n=1 Tax=unclassified Streptomyces TaxID=2593676 RepID=UPI0036EB2459
MFSDAEGHAVEAAEGKMGDRWKNGLKDTMGHTGDAARHAAEGNPSVDAGDAAPWVRDSSRQGYINARSILMGQSPGAITTP